MSNDFKKRIKKMALGVGVIATTLTGCGKKDMVNTVEELRKTGYPVEEFGLTDNILDNFERVITESKNEETTPLDVHQNAEDLLRTGHKVIKAKMLSKLGYEQDEIDKLLADRSVTIRRDDKSFVEGQLSEARYWIIINGEQHSISNGEIMDQMDKVIDYEKNINDMDKTSNDIKEEVEEYARELEEFACMR